LVKAVRELRGDGPRFGRPWCLPLPLPLPEQVLLVVMYYCTNLTMRQLAVLFEASAATVCRTVKRLGPLLERPPGPAAHSGSRQRRAPAVSSPGSACLRPDETTTRRTRWSSRKLTASSLQRHGCGLFELMTRGSAMLLRYGHVTDTMRREIAGRQDAFSLAGRRTGMPVQ
jgi:hypothetical protein